MSLWPTNSFLHPNLSTVSPVTTVAVHAVRNADCDRSIGTGRQSAAVADDLLEVGVDGGVR